MLAHAAFEEFFEVLAIRVLDKSIEKYIYGKNVNDVLLSLMFCYGIKHNIDDDEKNKEIRIYDITRKMLDEVKQLHSRYLMEGNHGTSTKYLRKILLPVAIDVPEDDGLKNSLSQLAKMRGDYAHKHSTRKICSPEDAIKYVGDCIDICNEVVSSVKAKNLF